MNQMLLKLTDNTKVSVESVESIPVIHELLNKDISDLYKENFLIFPPDIKESSDLESENCIFEQRRGQVWTNNIAGIFRHTNDEVRIHSRFSSTKAEASDFFLRYLLQKVLNYNVVSSDLNLNSELLYYDLLAYLFPFYLNRAMAKGLYKEYIHRKYNDMNLKGSLDIGRHVKDNLPFIGKVAYNTREFSHDNPVLQLVRHTIEKLKHKKLIYANDDCFKQNVKMIEEATPQYFERNRQKIVQENKLQRLRHSYFQEYYELQDLCLKILLDEKVGFGNQTEKVHGIIIDIAWLWEEYLNLLLKSNFTHSENKTKKNPIYFYQGQKSPRYPDFYSEKIILDAKYKRLDKNRRGGISREDLYQITSYLHVKKADFAGLIYPSQSIQGYEHIGELEGFGGSIFKIGVEIPQEVDNYEEFSQKMRTSEDRLLTELGEICS